MDHADANLPSDPPAFPRLASLADAIDRAAPPETTPDPDLRLTVAHLIDGALDGAEHAIEHCERCVNPETDDLARLEHHLRSSRDHLIRAAAHLEQWPSDPKAFKAQRDALKAHQAQPTTEPTQQN